jgi:hypothetical protein
MARNKRGIETAVDHAKTLLHQVKVEYLRAYQRFLRKMQPSEILWPRI